MQRFISIILCEAFSIGKNNKFIRFLLAYASRKMLQMLKIRGYVCCFLIKYSSLFTDLCISKNVMNIV